MNEQSVQQNQRVIDFLLFEMKTDPDGLICSGLTSAVEVSKCPAWRDHRAAHVGYYASCLWESRQANKTLPWSVRNVHLSMVNWTAVGAAIIREIEGVPA